MLSLVYPSFLFHCRWWKFPLLLPLYQGEQKLCRGFKRIGGLTGFAFCSTRPVLAKSDSAEIILYQYEACPFCSKVRSFLDYHKLPYSVVEVDPMRKQELAFLADYKKVPVLKYNNQVIKDSKEIVDFLCKQVDCQQTNEDMVWRKWIDENIMKLLSPNIYRTPREAFQAFEYINSISNFSSAQKIINKVFGAAVMYLVAKRNKKKHELGDERQSLYDAVDHWLAKAVGNKKFAGGDVPSVADIDMYGVMKALSMMKCTWTDVDKNTSVKDWFRRMEDKIGGSSRVI
ncbi:prostaglandin E synthase 2-like isoform X2 [Zophobas morio]|uniref:prostaglandin E synthase 2-like isoform X2 n=1 Tax=Zophobas morio TaxID=2755281 RepID=UPI003083526C